MNVNLQKHISHSKSLSLPLFRVFAVFRNPFLLGGVWETRQGLIIYPKNVLDETSHQFTFDDCEAKSDS